MKKLIFLLLAFAFILTACNTPDTESVNPDSSKLPINNTDGNKLYVANISTKTYHLSSCYLAESISEENRLETKDQEFLRSRKYTSCKICVGANG